MSVKKHVVLTFGLSSKFSTSGIANATALYKPELARILMACCVCASE